MLEVAAVFVYIGLEPNTALLHGHRLELGPDRSGYPPTPGCAPRLRGVFAAGAVRSGSPGRAVGAAGEGATAALPPIAYLSDGDLAVTVGRLARA